MKIAGRLAAATVAFVLLFAPVARASRLEIVHVPTERLAAFGSGGPHDVAAAVLLPDSYDSAPAARYPVIYWFHEFGGKFETVARDWRARWLAAFKRRNRESIVVFPDPMFGPLYTAFADSQNNGPWGEAFADDIVPFIDAHYRTSGARYLAGLSSGGWTSLWLQITYPQLFSGVWSYAPDPVDFRNFTDVDLTTLHPDNYYETKGDPLRIYQVGIIDRETHRQFVASLPMQFASFNYAFSPRAPSGYAARLFDLNTGKIDPAVAAYWEAHYDIRKRIIDELPAQESALRGKIHVIVGSDDTFHLEKSVALLRQALSSTELAASFTYVRYGTHWSILDWDGGAASHILSEMEK